MHRYGSLDTLRSFAILLVILAHSVLSYGAPSYLAPLQLGGIGVDLFFVLSGWLLGSQLLKEQERNGSIDIKRFWIRRWFRTLPAYYAVLSVLIIQQYIGNSSFAFPWSYLFFLQNYNDYLTFFSVSWSLCVEEQFYLFVAPFLFFIHKFKPTHRTVFLVAILVSPAIFRGLDWFDSGYSNTLQQVDCCIMGVLLAQVSLQYKNLWNRFSKYAFPLSLISLVLFISFFILRYTPEYSLLRIDNLILALIFGSWIMLANKNEFWKNAIYFKGANYIATRSYGMYLLHPEVLTLQKKVMLDYNFFMYFCFSLIGSAILAEILYRCLEKPFIDLRERFNFSKSTPV